MSKFIAKSDNKNGFFRGTYASRSELVRLEFSRDEKVWVDLPRELEDELWCCQQMLDDARDHFDALEEPEELAYPDRHSEIYREVAASGARMWA